MHLNPWVSRGINREPGETTTFSWHLWPSTLGRNSWCKFMGSLAQAKPHPILADAAIKVRYLPKLFATDNPWLSPGGELWGVFCGVYFALDTALPCSNLCHIILFITSHNMHGKYNKDRWEKTAQNANQIFVIFIIHQHYTSLRGYSWQLHTQPDLGKKVLS